MRVGAVTTAVILVAGSLDARLVLAQDPCAVLAAKAAEVMGAPAGKPETGNPPRAIVCEVRSTDRNVHLSLTQQLNANAGQTLAMQSVLAGKVVAKPDTYALEPSLGPNAYSVRSAEQFLVSCAVSGRVLALSLNRDGGVTDADVERVRALARAMRPGK